MWTEKTKTDSCRQWRAIPGQMKIITLMSRLLDEDENNRCAPECILSISAFFTRGINAEKNRCYQINARYTHLIKLRLEICKTAVKNGRRWDWSIFWEDDALSTSWRWIVLFLTACIQDFIHFILMIISSDNFTASKHSSQAKIALILNNFKKIVHMYQRKTQMIQWSLKHFLSLSLKTPGRRPLAVSTLDNAIYTPKSQVRGIFATSLTSVWPIQAICLQVSVAMSSQTCLCHFYLFCEFCGLAKYCINWWS
jgi:hypothetical protein